MMIDGIFLLDKPIDISSNAALQRVKHLFKAKKAGHTGSLDPLATGMLPICFGKATKFSQCLLDADKTYAVTMQLGVRTTTSDREGEVIATRKVPLFSMSDIDRAFDVFRGDIQQVPSMFSALKYQGKPLYYYARQGITVERSGRAITIYSIQVNSIAHQSIQFTVHCSKGTYVRTLVDDIGEYLGCGAHVMQLRRLTVGPYQEKEMTTIEQLKRNLETQGAESLLLSLNNEIDRVRNHSLEKIVISE